MQEAKATDQIRSPDQVKWGGKDSEEILPHG